MASHSSTAGHRHQLQQQRPCVLPCGDGGFFGSACYSRYLGSTARCFGSRLRATEYHCATQAWAAACSAEQVERGGSRTWSRQLISSDCCMWPGANVGGIY